MNLNCFTCRILPFMDQTAAGFIISEIHGNFTGGISLLTHCIYMKKTAFASAALSIMALVMGLLFLVHDIPYSYYILAISLFLLAASLVVFYTFDKEYMYIAGAVFCFLPMFGLMLRQLSLPGADLLVTVGLVLFGLIFIPWYAMKCYKK